MKKEMLINVLQPEECRIAIVEDGVLEELYVERTSHESYVGNIYKGRIVNIEPSIQAAFVDFGVGRNGFLHVSDVEPAYYRHLEGSRRQDNGGRRGGGRGGRPGRGRRDDDEGGRAHGRRRPPQDLEQPRYAAVAPEDEAADFSAPQEPAAELEGRDIYRTEPDDTRPDTGGEEFSALPGTEAATEMEAPVPAEPEGSRRRGRGRRGPRRGRAEDTVPEQGTDAPTPAEPEAASPEQAEPQEPQRPRPMNSAERRTKEEDPELEPLSPRPDDDDDSNHRGAAFDEGPGEHEEREETLAAVEVEDALEAEESVEPEDDFLADEIPQRRMNDFDDEEPPAPRRRDDRRGGRRPMGRRMGGRPGAGRPKPLIQDIFRRGQEVLVQVIKEGIGTKGPTLSTYISIAGRYLVLMPGLNRIGVSRKITDEEQRRRLKEILSELQPPKGLGFIIRTAGLDRTKKELQRDLAYLSRLWQVVVRRIRKLKSPAEIYQESDMITRTIRDTFTSEIDTIWVDEQAAFEHAQEFLTIVMPRYANRIKFYDGAEPMFHKYGIEDEIARIQRKHVPLPNGGSIVIEQTEALVAIDVNSGNFRADKNAEETAYQMNLLAAREIARQLRLRDLGGVIVNDFIDMRDEKHRRGVEKAMRDAVKRDRARTKLLKISAFGIIEMTRQRIRPSLKRSIYQDCPHCLGNGQVKTCESMSIDVMRMLQLAAHRPNIHRIQARVHEDVAGYLLNRKRKEIARLEEALGAQVIISAAHGVAPEFLEFVCYDNNNNEVKFLSYEEPKPRRR